MPDSPLNPKLSIFPETAEVNAEGHLVIGGCDTVALAKQFGTPLYIYDEAGLREKCREFLRAFSVRYPQTRVIFASKAFLNRAVAGIIKEEGLGLDVVSGGELSTALAANFPAAQIYFHGNNKTRDEIELALKWRIGRFVVDNQYELEMLNELAGRRAIKQEILLRVTPGVDAHTHAYTTTGIVDSKFGFQLMAGKAEEAVRLALAAPNLKLIGLHFHLGSPIFEPSVYELGIETVLKLAATLKSAYRFQMQEFSVGGGFAVQYVLDTPAPAVGDYAQAICAKLTSTLADLKLGRPTLVIEPGRSVVARSGVALYTVGAIKQIPGVRTYVCVDGGMGDNIRPAIYGARYHALLANKVTESEVEKVTIAGKYCESGDILTRDEAIGPVESGDLVALPVAGAYCIPMSSNYNSIPRPAVVMVREGQARLIRRRERYADLMRLDT